MGSGRRGRDSVEREAGRCRPSSFTSDRLRCFLIWMLTSARRPPSTIFAREARTSKEGRGEETEEKEGSKCAKTTDERLFPLHEREQADGEEGEPGREHRRGGEDPRQDVGRDRAGRQGQV